MIVSGAGWADGCPEPREGGCGDEVRDSALADIEIWLVPQEASRASIPLGSVDAGGGDYGFELPVVVPRSTPPGRYEVEARSGGHVDDTAPVRVVAGD